MTMLPLVQANSTDPGDLIWVDVMYNDEQQAVSSFMIENMMSDLTIEINDADLSQGIDISQIEPEEGDFIILKAILDPNDPTKIRTICFVYLAGYIVRTVQMYSNMATLGDLDASNTGQNIDWNTQILTENMNQASPPGSPTYLTPSRSSDLVLIVNWVHEDEYEPACDYGFRYEVKFEFFLENPSDPSRTSKVTHTEKDEVNGGFCTNPTPPEPARTDPELRIRLSPPPMTTLNETFRASGSIMLSVHEQVAEYDNTGQGIGWNEVDSRHAQVFGPSCQLGVSCYHFVEVTWT